jgi:hypothetical protein
MSEPKLGFSLANDVDLRTVVEGEVDFFEDSFAGFSGGSSGGLPKDSGPVGGEARSVGLH